MSACDRPWRRRAMADDIERFAALVEVVRRLRAPDGCPWDREQTPASLRATMLEEAYEVLEAIDERSIPKLREELGDVLLQVLMQSAIAQETGDFTLGDVADAVREKLVRRHPHVFGSTVVSGGRPTSASTGPTSKVPSTRSARSWKSCARRRRSKHGRRSSVTSCSPWSTSPASSVSTRRTRCAARPAGLRRVFA